MNTKTTLPSLLCLLMLSAAIQAGPPRSFGQSLSRGVSSSQLKSSGLSSRSNFGNSKVQSFTRNTFSGGGSQLRSNFGGNNSSKFGSGRISGLNQVNRVSPKINVRTNLGSLAGRVANPNIGGGKTGGIIGGIKLPTGPKNGGGITLPSIPGRGNRGRITLPFPGKGGITLPTTPGKGGGITLPTIPGKGGGITLPTFPGNGGGGKPNDHDHGGNHGSGSWSPHPHRLHPPICLPPIVKCPPPRVCPPCVLAVCPGAVVLEQSTEQILTEFLIESPPVAPEYVLDLQSNAEVSLEIDGLTGQPGAMVLEINGIGLPVDVLYWENGVLDIRVPSVGLSEPKLGKLYVLNAELQLTAAVDARLHPASE